LCGALCAGRWARMASLLTSLFQFLKQNDLKTIISRVNSRETHPVIQFIKYAISGVLALSLHILIFTLLVRFFYPKLSDLSSSPWDRALASFEPTAIAFIIVNAFVYWLNTRWVFTPGRHSPVMEFLYFTLVNMPGAMAGSLGQAALINFLNWHPLVAMIGFIVPNVLINFVCRKFFIFKS
jgi:putative flippase GtrA